MKSERVNQQKVPASASRERYRAVLADENPLCRKGLHVLLLEDGRFNIVAETDNGETALKLILDQKPDVAILDAALPGLSGLEIAALLKTKNRAANLVLLASLKDERLFNQAINLGVKGFVLKRNTGSEILDCVRTVARGESYISSLLTDFLLRRRSSIESLGKRKPGLGNLTRAERRILKRIAQGKTSREIAAESGVSPRTVDSHRAHICEKLGLSGSNRLLQFALEHRDALSHLD
ncbi:MAG TPA: response regulator transcription factor [Candidatus Angelobacter sp.]|nr:response regulator transcription factor [Candidatus Angelobacter sp.]